MTQMWLEYKPLPKPWWHSDKDWEELKPELPEPWKACRLPRVSNWNNPRFTERNDNTVRRLGKKRAGQRPHNDAVEIE